MKKINRKEKLKSSHEENIKSEKHQASGKNRCVGVSYASRKSALSYSKDFVRIARSENDLKTIERLKYAKSRKLGF